MDGYPREFVFETREQIDDYLSGDRITCLLCGRSFRALPRHLKYGHAMSDDDYRVKYGIPYTRGLHCRETMEKMRLKMLERQADDGDHFKALLKVAKAKQIANGNLMRANTMPYWVNEHTKYTRADFDEFVRRVLSGRPSSDVSNDPDVPSRTQVDWYRKRDKDFDEIWQRVVRPEAAIGLSAKDRANRRAPPPPVEP